MCPSFLKMDKTVMYVRQKSLMQQNFSPKHEGDGDNCSKCTSKWSSDSRLGSASGVSQYSSECEYKGDRSPYDSSLAKWRGPKPSGLKKGNKGPGDKQRTNHPHLKLLPVRRLEHPKPSIQSKGLAYIRGMECPAWDLQQQLAEARPENKLLKRAVHHHMMALQHSQDSQDSISQIFAKHKNEAKYLRKLLRQTRTCRDNYARQLQAAENKLHSTKTAFHHLQLLSQDQSLLEREELTIKLAKATAELEEKDRRIQDLDKKLDLCQASFKRQLAAEQRKIKNVRETFCFLQNIIDQLSREKQDIEKELEKHNFCYHTFIKGPSKKGRENKMDQKETSSPLETKFSEFEGRFGEQEGSVSWCFNKLVLESLVKEGKSSANVALDEKTRSDHTVCLGDNTSEDSDVKNSPGLHAEDDRAKESEASEGKQETAVACVLETSLDETKTNYELPKIRHKYTFKPSTENLHNGRPAFSRADMSKRYSAKST